MVHSFLRYLFLLLLLAPILRAQTSDTLTSLPRFTAPPVLVEASRLPLHATSPGSLTVLDASVTTALPGLTAADALSGGAGVALRSYGGSSAMQLPALRGLGSEYAVVLMDGVRLNDAQSGVVDLSRLSLFHLGTIEVALGGYSSLVGSDALGGVLSLRGARSITQSRVELGAGAWGWRSARGATSLRTGPLIWRLAAEHERADNDYPFTWNGISLRRAHAESERNSASLDAALGTELRGFLLVGSTRVGVPGPVLGPEQGRAEQEDRDLTFGLSYRPQPSFGGALSLSTSLRYAVRQYRDPGLITNGSMLDSRADNLSLGLDAGWDRTWSPLLRSWFGLSLRSDRLDASDLSSHPNRITLALSAGGDLTPLASTDLHIYPALRGEIFQESVTGRNQELLAPSLGLHWQATPVLAFRTRAALGHRIPTFNQLYWNPGGNPTLTLERAASVDLGAEFSLAAQGPTFEITFFEHDIRDKIVWTPTGSTIWTPRNIQSVRTRGIEFALHGSVWESRLRFRIQAELMDSRKQNASFLGDLTEGKQLIYVPPTSATAWLIARLLSWCEASVSARYLGIRSYTETNDASLPPVLTTDLALTATFKPMSALPCALKVEVLNLLDTRYESVAFYPQPPRSLRASLFTTLPSLSQE